MKFEESDAWVLAALVWGRKPAIRWWIKFAGDGINKAWMTDEELEGGLRRLVEAGYAFRRRGLICERFGPTQAALDFVKSVDYEGKTSFQTWGDLEILLGLPERWHDILKTPPEQRAQGTTADG